MIKKIRQHPYRASALLFFLLAFAFLSRVLWPPQGMALGAHDIRALFYPWLEFTRNAILSGRLPLWDADLFSGYPFLSNPQIALFYLPTWLAILLPVRIGISWHVLFHLCLASMGMMLFVRQMSRHWLGATLAGLAFAFSGYASARIWAGHIGLLATNSWLPWMMLAIVWAVRKKTVWAGVLAGVPFAAAILAGHTTSLIYLAVAWGAFAIYLLIQTENKWLVVRQYVLAGVVGIGLSGVQLLPLLEFSQMSTRAGEASFDFAAAFSLPPAHLITLLLPGFFGEPVRAGYWSVPTFEELTYYAGLLPLIGLVLALRKPTRLVWFYVGLMLLGLLLALGSYGFLFEWAYTWIPLFQLARAPGRAAFLFLFAITALLGEAVAIWSRVADEEKRPLRLRSVQALSSLFRILIPTLIITGIAALAATGAVFAAQHPTDTSGRLWQQIGGWGLFVVLAPVGALLLWRYLTLPSEKTRQRTWAAVGLIVVLLVDLWSFGWNLVELHETAVPALWPDAANLIGDTDSRVLPWGVSIFDQNGADPVGLTSVFGYNALEVGANTAFTGSVPDPRATTYDILAAKYVIAYQSQERFEKGERPLTLIGNTANVWVYERARTMPVARLVSGYELIPDDEQAIARVHEADFDPETAVILNKTPACDFGDTSKESGTVEILAQADGYWQLQTNSAQPALLVLSETDYPGWQVTVDGQKAVGLTAYTAVRAVCVPAGEHIVEWAFRPMSFVWGGGVSVLTLLLVGLAFFKNRIQIDTD